MPFFPTRIIQLRDIKGINQNSTAVINCPKGPRYRRIILGLQATDAGNGNAPAITAVSAGDLSVTLGSKVIRTLTATQLDYLNTQNGAQYASYGVASATNGQGTTYLPIYFEEPWRKRADFQNGLACETGWMDTNGVFQIAVPLNGTSAAPNIFACAIVDDFNSGRPNPIMKFYKDDVGTTAATLDIANLFQGAPPSDLVESMSLFDPSDSVAQSKAVTKARLVLGSTIVLDDVTADQNVDLLKGADMNPTVGAYNIVMDHDDLFESLRQVGTIGSSQLTLTLKAASAGTLRRITQRLGDPTL